MELGYARVSTTHQDLARQLDALAKHGIPDERIYADKKTGATIDRAGFTELLRYARTGDTIVATNLGWPSRVTCPGSWRRRSVCRTRSGRTRRGRSARSWPEWSPARTASTIWM
jgi:predicted site-specific integrase-resolvase